MVVSDPVIMGKIIREAKDPIMVLKIPTIKEINPQTTIREDLETIRRIKIIPTAADSEIIPQIIKIRMADSEIIQKTTAKRIILSKIISLTETEEDLDKTIINK